MHLLFIFAPTDLRKQQTLLMNFRNLASSAAFCDDKNKQQSVFVNATTTAESLD